ncbi:MAG: hypothetical protein ACKVT2_20130 [Saprospiraceae bacterium]
MSTAARIQNEVNTLPKDLQSKVLAYVEWLKYRDLLQKAAQMATELGGIQSFTEEDTYRLFEQSTKSETLEGLAEKAAIAERVNAALKRMKLGAEGVSNEKMKSQAKQWRKR